MGVVVVQLVLRLLVCRDLSRWLPCGYGCCSTRPPDDGDTLESI